jgi:N-acetylglucosamine-6-phosphate deacetylase
MLCNFHPCISPHSAFLITLMRNILTAAGWAFGSLVSDAAGIIAAIDAVPVHTPVPGNGYILPGFIDLHIHGAGGVDLMEGLHATSVVAATHARTGTTSFLATGRMPGTLRSRSAHAWRMGRLCRTRPQTEYRRGLGRMKADPLTVQQLAVQDSVFNHSTAGINF